MRIEHVKINNWRSIKSIEIDFKHLMVFIGQNNHGKSNILSALLFFFGQIKQTKLDFNNTEEEIKVEVTFTDLHDNDKSNFKKYITTDNKIKVQKKGTLDGSIEYHGYLENPVNDWLKEDKIAEYNKREIAETLPLYDKLPPNGRISKDVFLKAQIQYIKENRDNLEFNYELETTNFLGLTTVAQGIFGEIFFIPAVKNAADELALRGKSIFNQLYSRIIIKYAEKSISFQEVKNGINNLISLLNKTTSEGEINENRPVEFGQLEEDIKNEMEAWNTSIEIEVDPPNVEDIIKNGTNVWVDDGTKTDIERKGHGLQRALIFALIKVWSKQLRIGESDSQQSTRKASESSYFIIEEPELYLHPQAQKELYSSLTNISETDAQVIFSTHSSAFLDLERYKSIVIVFKENLEIGTKLLQCHEELFYNLDEKKKFNLNYWINPDRGELFFSKKVILVEGPTDKIIIPYIAKKIGCYRYEYSIIDCSSKTNIPLYLSLMNKFKLPYIAVYDKDHQAHKNQEKIDTANNQSEAIESNIIEELGSSVIFENDIEEEIGILENNNKNKPYKALEHVSDKSFTISNSFEEKIRKIFT